MASKQFSIRALSRIGMAALMALAVAACTTLVPQTAQRLRTLDYRSDDLASLLVAFDLPAGLQPVPESSVLHFSFIGKNGQSKNLLVTLTFTDPGELASTLPPPTSGRAYYFLGFSEADRTALREAQAWVREQSGSATGTSPISVRPQFCTSDNVDLARATFSVLVALPGAGALEPLVRNYRVMDTLVGKTVGEC